ncbi:MAG: LytTR family DNA-binding domain-containing protein, partial [Bacteroidota bacterium]
SFNYFRLERNLLRASITRLHEQLSTDQFFRCHRSYVVNCQQAFTISGNARGYTLTSKKHGFSIPVARSKIQKMKQVFGLS